MQVVPLGDQARAFEREGQGLLRCSVQRGQRPAGDAVYLEGTLDALRVVRHDAPGRVWIDLLQLCVQRGPAVLRGARLDGLPDSRIRPRQLVQPGREGAVVEHRTADELVNFSPAKLVLDGADGTRAELAGGIALVRIHQVEEVMRHPRALGRAGLGGADVHAAVDLRRVDRDYLERILLGELQREARLAARRRSQQREGRAQGANGRR